MRALSKILFEHTFETGQRVVVTNFGVTLWDERDGRWLIDASTIAEGDDFNVSKDIKERKNIPRQFIARYLAKPPGKPGRKRTKK